MNKLVNNWLLLVSFLCFCSCLQKHKKVKSSQQNSSYHLSWSNFGTDTSKYLLGNFYYHQNQYKNKKFSFFLEHLELPVIYYCPIYKPHPIQQSPLAKDSCIGITLGFFPYDLMKQKINQRINPAILGIYFKKTLSMDKVMSIQNKDARNYSEFTPALKKYWAEQIIDTIGYTRDPKHPYIK